MDLREAILSRKTIWHYSDREVEPEKIDEILSLARWAPSGGNTQPWDWVVVTEPRLRVRMREMVKEAHRKWMTEAVPVPRPASAIEEIFDWIDGYTGSSVVYLVCCVTERPPADAKRRARSEYSLLMDNQSAGGALQTLMLAATSLGLGTHWVGAATIIDTQLHDLLSLPANTRVFAIVTLGYPAEDGNLRGTSLVERTRLPLESVAHYNGW